MKSRKMVDKPKPMKPAPQPKTVTPEANRIANLGRFAHKPKKK